MVRDGCNNLIPVRYPTFGYRKKSEHKHILDQFGYFYQSRNILGRILTDTNFFCHIYARVVFLDSCKLEKLFFKVYF